MPAKKPAAKKSTRAKKRGGLTSALGPKATTALVICVLAGGLTVGARQQYQQQMKAKDLAATMAPDGAGNDNAPAASSRPSKAVVSTSISNASIAPAAKTSANRAVTVTGCLEKSDEGYRLKDTSGAAAPKSRSWKSGFLKKGAASVDVVDASHSLALNSEVGRRVAVTGPLTDRELRAQSVQRVAASCKAN
jgi:hypothetical protein